MKNFKTLAITLLLTVSTVFVYAQNKKIDVAKSKINWVGKKVTGEHEGTINLESGTLIFKQDKLVGGTFTVDMNSINTTDLAAGEGKEKLDGHLKADDFFGTEKYPTSVLTIKTIGVKSKDVYSATADLTIKGKTNSINFEISVRGNTATAKLVIDRTKFDIKYGSGSFFENLGDKTISDNFDLKINLAF